MINSVLVYAAKGHDDTSHATDTSNIIVLVSFTSIFLLLCLVAYYRVLHGSEILQCSLDRAADAHTVTGMHTLPVSVLLYPHTSYNLSLSLSLSLAPPRSLSLSIFLSLSLPLDILNSNAMAGAPFMVLSPKRVFLKVYHIMLALCINYTVTLGLILGWGAHIASECQLLGHNKRHLTCGMLLIGVAVVFDVLGRGVAYWYLTSRYATWMCLALRCVVCITGFALSIRPDLIGDIGSMAVSIPLSSLSSVYPPVAV
eukprot:TRINITY_DN1446_c0_g1_i13.p1 TRINITY_DN1446_c0_g1~~TRINITY_DN1446_c0_g1_i13.p1  ORF type:complete len:256 (-),score=39.14 TRINITY_DN1446_c0_g1_i13:39-806(-)